MVTFRILTLFAFFSMGQGLISCQCCLIVAWTVQVDSPWVYACVFRAQSGCGFPNDIPLRCVVKAILPSTACLWTSRPGSKLIGICSTYLHRILQPVKLQRGFQHRQTLVLICLLIFPQYYHPDQLCCERVMPFPYRRVGDICR